MTQYEEDINVGKEAYKTFSNFLNHLPEEHEYKSNLQHQLSIGMIWFTAFCMGHDFAKTNNVCSILNQKESLN